MALTILPGTPADIPTLAALYDTVIDRLEATVNYPGWKKGIYPTEEDAARGIAEGTLFVARSGETVCGSVILRHRPEPGYDAGSWDKALPYDRILVVYTLAVHPAYQNRGVATALLAHAETMARQQGCAALRLDAAQGNTPAIALYRRCGYRYAGTVSLGYEAYGLPWFELYEKQLL